MPASRPTFAAMAALTCAALALWASLGTVAFVRAGASAPYILLLPPITWLLVLVIAAVLLGVSIRPPAHDLLPLWLSLVCLLPCLPLRLPHAVFVWTGAARAWLWGAIIASVTIPPAWRRWRGSASASASMATRRAVCLAGVLSAAAYLAGAWIDAPRHPGGDEPHYLVIAQSLIADHDLQIENNHRQRDYLAYFDGPLRPDFLRRGTNGEIYSIHAPGLPFLLAPVFRLFGYVGVVVALALTSAFGGALAWLVAWRVTRNGGASWFAWASVALSAPFFLHASAVYPDAVAAVIVLAASLPLVDPRARRPDLLLGLGAALAYLPWLHTRYAVLAATAGLAIAGRLLTEASGRATRLAALAAFPLASAALWLGYFRVIYGVFDPSAPYGGATNTSLENVVRGLPGLLFDQQFGLLANAPVFLCAVLGFGVLLRRGPRRLGVELLVISVPYVAVVSVFYMWWGGFSAPARFLVPLTLLLVIPTASWYATRRTIAARTAGLAALYVSLAITATLALVDRGDLSINVRDGASRLLTWLSPVVDLTTAVPSLFQNPPAVATMHAAVWLAAALVVVLLAGTLGRTGQHARGGRATFAASVLILGVLAEMGAMVAASFVWQSNRAVVERPDTGALALLQQYEPDGRQIALAYEPFRRVRLRDVPPLLALTHTVDPSSGEQSVLLHVPPGTYEVSGTSTAAGDGFVRVVMDSESAPLAEWRAASFGPTWSTRFTLPVGVHALRIDVDAAARRTIRDVSVRAVSILPRRQRLVGNPEAERVGRYGPAVVFLLGGTAWLEPPGAWVAPGAGADVAIMPDAGTPIRLLVRNGPLQNVITLRSGAWHAEVVLQPDDERIIDIPTAGDTPTTPLHVQAVRGIRPADADPTSQDRRLLGVWIETR